MRPVFPAKPWRIILLAAALPGCSNTYPTLYQDPGVLGSTLADLPPAEMPQRAPEPSPPANLDDIEQSYRSALEVVTDPDTRQRILVRLADIEMARSENRQLAQAEQEEHFDEAIDLYDELLEKPATTADPATDERLLYQLAKAYALDGRMAESDAVLAQMAERYPDSRYAAEIYFRRAEQAFSEGRYAEAQNLYQRVIQFGEQTSFYLNALYMQGWSQFKASRFREGVESFTAVLDRLLPEGTTSIEALPDAQRNLAADTLRVLAMTFTYLDGAESVAEVYAELGERHYQPLIYQQLGGFYLEKERYLDAADTFAEYAEANPSSSLGPEFAVRRIDVFRQGGQAQMMLPAKEEFVRNYGIGSEFWAKHSRAELEKLVLPTLAEYLDELSSFYHAQGQQLQAAAKNYRPGQDRKAPEPAEPYFDKAAAYYDEFAQTFPDSPRLAEITFLKAEALLQAGRLAQAVDAYEKVAFELNDPERGAEAGYAAVLALQQLVDQASPEQKSAWQARSVTAARNFADYFPGDERAPAVLAQAANDLFTRGEREQAVALAERLIAWQPAVSEDIQQTSWLILAHSRFDAGQFDAAEEAYRQVLARLQPKDPERAAVVERIAASMFQSAEQLAAAGQREQAVERLLAIGATAPGSDIAIKAQYDAGNYLMELENWARAEAVFTDFRESYLNHPLVATLTPKFAVIYQASEQWEKAAGILAQMARSGDPAARRESLYLSAELFEKAGETWEAALRYAEYVKTYPEPFDLAIEARYKLVQLAEVREDEDRREYWQRQLIKAHDEAGNLATDRSRYLAAQAANQLAAESFGNFERIKLTLPIQRSLKAKQRALEETLGAYRKVMNYDVAEFSTEANFRIGEVYRQLSRDLLDSERPRGLDDLALEQYEILLEEQALPFEEKSVELLEANAQRAWSGFYDEWVKRSFDALAKLLPARYGKQEKVIEVSNGIY